MFAIRDVEDGEELFVDYGESGFVEDKNLSKDWLVES